MRKLCVLLVLLAVAVLVCACSKRDAGAPSGAVQDTSSVVSGGQTASESAGETSDITQTGSANQSHTDVSVPASSAASRPAVSGGNAAGSRPGEDTSSAHTAAPPENNASSNAGNAASSRMAEWQGPY